MTNRALVQITDCLAAMRARVVTAEMRHAAELRAEATAQDATIAAEAVLVAADADWRRQMAEGFDPSLGSLLGSVVRGAAATLIDAEGKQAEAGQAARCSAAAWHGEDARCRALEEQAGIARRRVRYRADERLLAALADRETFRRRGQ